MQRHPTVALGEARTDDPAAVMPKSWPTGIDSSYRCGEHDLRVRRAFQK